MFTLFFLNASKYAHLIMLCVGCMIGFYVCSLFNGCGPRVSLAVSGDAKMVTKLEAQVEGVQAVYHARIDSLGTVSKHLQTDLQTTRVALVKAKQKNAALQTQIYSLLDRPSPQLPDTAAQLADCDSLKGKIRDLIAGDSTRDSLYERATADLQKQVALKDSVLQVQQASYQSLKADFDRSLTEGQALQDETKALRRSLRRQKVVGTVRTIGLVVAIALAAHFFTH